MLYEICDEHIKVRLTTNKGLNESEIFLENFKGYPTYVFSENLIYVVYVNKSNKDKIIEELDSVESYICTCYDDLVGLEEVETYEETPVKNNKIIITQLINSYVEENLLKKILQNVFDKKSEYEAVNKKFDYLQIIEFCKNPTTNETFLCYRQEEVELDNIDEFKEILNMDFNLSLVGKKIYIIFEHTNEDVICNILFSEEY